MKTLRFISKLKNKIKQSSSVGFRLIEIGVAVFAFSVIGLLIGKALAWLVLPFLLVAISFSRQSYIVCLGSFGIAIVLILFPFDIAVRDTEGFGIRIVPAITESIELTQRIKELENQGKLINKDFVVLPNNHSPVPTKWAVLVEI